MDSTRILRLKDVTQQTGLSRSTIYELVKLGRFPSQVKLSQRAVGWRSREVTEWIEARR